MTRSRFVVTTEMSYGRTLPPSRRLAVLNTWTGPTRSNSSIGGTTKTTTRRVIEEALRRMGMTKLRAGAAELNELAETDGLSSGFAERGRLSCPRVNEL